MRVRRAVMLACAVVAMLATAAGAASSTGVTRPPRPARQLLYGVSATSPTDAWAVGQDLYGSQLPGIPFSSSLILHWDGRTWSRVPSPGATEGTAPILTAVSAVSSTDVWAMGSDGNSPSGLSGRPLILHWDGSSWRQIPGPGGSSVSFSGVSADSATDAWAVGTAGGRPLIVHWNGSTWKRVALPTETSGIVGVSALSATNVWAAGYSNGIRSLLLRWTGSAWRKAKLAAGRFSFLVGVSPRSPGRVWAGGQARAEGRAGGGSKLSIVSCDASSCMAAKHPALGGTVAAISASSPRVAWAVGDNFWAVRRGTVTVEDGGWIVRWNGRAWKPSPDPVRAGGLSGVSTVADGEAWAVGSRASGRSEIPVILHWNGGSWHPQTPSGL